MRILTKLLILPVLLCSILSHTDSFALNMTGRSTIGKSFQTTNNSTSRIQDSEYGAGLTFSKDYRNTNSVDADFSVGSPTGTFTRDAGATTYIDVDGVIQTQSTVNIPRFTAGYYDTTGFVGQPGLMMEGASTNLLKNSYCSLGTTTATNWVISEDDTNNDTPTLVDSTDLMNISGANAQRIQITFSDATYFLINQDLTAVGSVVDTNVVTYSCWIKGTVGGSVVRLRIRESDAAGTQDTAHFGSDIASSVSSTEWRKFSVTATMVDADCSRVLGSINFSTIPAGAVDFQITGVQMEVLPFASSFIPTTTAAVTRGNELLKYVVASNRTAASESHIVKLSPAFADSLTGARYITSTGVPHRGWSYVSANDHINIFPNSTDDAGTLVGDLINEAWLPNVSMTVGYSMQATGNPNIQGYYNGTADGGVINTDWTANAWSGDDFWVGNLYNGTLSFFGVIESMAFFSDLKDATAHAALANAMDSGL